LKIETELLENHQVKLIAEIDDQLYESYKHRAARKISQETKIPGFRPGKAPYNIVLRTVGEGAIQQEAIDLLIDEHYPKILEEAGVKPGGPGRLDDVLSLQPVKLSFVVPLEPEVNLGDFRSVRLPYEPKPLQDEEVEKFLKRLQRSYATLEPVERPAQLGDLVFGTLEGRLVHPSEGEDSLVIRPTPIQALVAPEEEQEGDEYPFPGFGLQLIGLSAGESKILTFQYADDADDENLRGKEVEFTVQVQSIKALILPELDDEFAQSIGYPSSEEMRSSIRTHLEEDARDAYDRDYFARLIDKILEGATVKYPPQMLDREIEEVLHNVEHDLSRQNLDLDTYLKMRRLDRQTFIDQEVKPVAIKRLERSLVMDEVARVEHIEADENEISSEYSQALSELQNAGDLRRIQRRIGTQRLANVIAMEAINRVMNRRVLERLKQIATGQAEAEPAKQSAADAPEGQDATPKENTSAETAAEPDTNTPKQSDDQ